MEWRQLLAPPAVGRVLSLDDNPHVVEGLRSMGIAAGVMAPEAVHALATDFMEVRRVSLASDSLVLTAADGTNVELRLEAVRMVTSGKVAVITHAYDVAARRRSLDMSSALLLNDPVVSRAASERYENADTAPFLVISAGRSFVLRFPRVDVSALGVSATTTMQRQAQTLELLRVRCPGAALERSFERNIRPSGVPALPLDAVQAAVLSSALHDLLQRAGVGPAAGARTEGPEPAPSLVESPRVAAEDTAPACASCNRPVRAPYYKVALRPRCEACMRLENPELLPGPERDAWRWKARLSLAGGSAITAVAVVAAGVAGFVGLVVVGYLWKSTFGDDDETRAAIDVIGVDGSTRPLSEMD